MISPMEAVFLAHNLPINADSRSVIMSTLMCIYIQAAVETHFIINEIVDEYHIHVCKGAYVDREVNKNYNQYIPRLTHINAQSTKFVCALSRFTHAAISTVSRRYSRDYSIPSGRMMLTYAIWLHYEHDKLMHIRISG